MKLIIDIPEEEYNECNMQVDMMRQEGFAIDSLSTAAKIHIANGTPLPNDCEILTKEAYSDLCLRAARADREEITLEQAINRLYELGWLQEHDRILAESNGHCEFVNLPPYAKEECEDCISRQATLDEIIKELCIKDESYLLQAERKIYYTVKYMPSVKPKRDDAKDDLK